MSRTNNQRHLIIVGGGSAAFAATLAASERGARVTMINDGLPIGGTCVNVGCVPSKTLIRAAETAHRAARHGFAGIETSSRVTDFSAIIGQKRQLVRELQKAKYLNVVADLPDFSLVEGRARLVDERTVEVEGKPIEGDRILIATGATPLVPPITGLEEAGYLTNETAFELDEQPESLLVVGGNYIGLEVAQMFARLGTHVTVVEMLERIMPGEMADLGDELAAHLREEGIEIVTSARIERVERTEGGIVAHAARGEEELALSAAQIVIAAGRGPNTWDMGLEDVGVELDSRGFVRVDASQETSVDGIYAAGDVTGGMMFVYTAADAGALAARNALSGDSLARSSDAIPWVVFTDPQVAGIGLDERQARELGVQAEAATLALSHVPRAIAARDTRGFIKLVRNRQTDRLIGARIVAPEGSELLMELSVAMHADMTVEALRALLHPYLTLGEGIKLAAITFGKDVAKLSCCAS